MIGLGVVLMMPTLQMRLAAAGGPVSDWADQRMSGVQTRGLGGQFGIGLLLGTVWAMFKFPLLYGLDEATMQELGLYISEPRSAQETDHLFSEPALFVINPDGLLHLIDIANAPFLRTDLDRLLSGLGFIIQKQYPIRGTHA